jgi:hypothetical protein
LSEQIHGRRKKVLDLDYIGLHGEGTANAVLRRYRDFFAFRHDLLTFDLGLGISWDIHEGECVGITCPEGENGGWVNEKFLCIERVFSSKGKVSLLLWRINPNYTIFNTLGEANAPSGKLVLEGGGYVTLEAGGKVDLEGN